MDSCLTSTDTLSVVALAEETVDTTDWEREAGLGGATASKLDEAVEAEVEEQANVRLRGLGARGLSARLAASHFDRVEDEGEELSRVT